MAGYEKASDIASRQRQGGGKIDFADLFVQIKVEKREGASVTKVFHQIGVPYGFIIHKPEMRDPENPKETKKVDFVDKEFNGSFDRICTEGDPAYGVCPWCERGYIKSNQWAVQVIDREDGKIRILKKGSGIFKELGKMEKTNAQYNERKGYKPTDAKALWTDLGGAKAPDFVITASFDKGALGNVAYLVSPEPEITEVTPEEIEALKAIRTMSDEDIAKLRAVSADWARMPEYAFHGYDVAFLHRPQLIRTSRGGNGGGATAAAPAAPQTAPSELNINGAEDDLPSPFTGSADEADDNGAAQDLAW